MTILVFPEGDTEDRIWKHFLNKTDAQLGIPTNPKPELSKNRIYGQIDTALGPRLWQEPLFVLVLIDGDEFTDHIPPDEVQGLTDVFKNLLKKRQPQGQTDLPSKIAFAPHKSYPNVYCLDLANPSLRVALHIATKRWSGQFTKSTIDDYVLELALKPETIAKFLEHKRWEQTKAAEIIVKIKGEIPDLMRRNHIPMVEAKIYVRWFAALMQVSTSPPTFDDLVFKNADPEDIKEVFASLLAAIAFLRG